MPTRILVLEWSGALARRVAALFPAPDYRVYVAPATANGLLCLDQFQPDLVLLWVDAAPDWGLIHEVRAMSAAPLIVCASDPGRDDAATTLRLGADDYIRWSIPSQELAARVRARLRRAAWQAGTTPHPPKPI